MKYIILFALIGLSYCGYTTEGKNDAVAWGLLLFLLSILLALILFMVCIKLDSKSRVEHMKLLRNHTLNI